jgi:alanyl-tRNA synthetase
MIMTIKRFWENPYLTELTTTIGSVEGDVVTLQETILFAFSGGQERDHGTINGYEVLDAEWVDSIIYYSLPSGHGLAVNDPVCVQIDWVRRYRLMRLHFAAELALVQVNRSLPGVQKIGAHIAEDKARLDFLWAESLSSVIPRLQADVNALIAADHPIISAFSDIKTERRYWEIDGYARVPCSGTHLHSTGEVGAIMLKRRNPGKGKERIEITLNVP